MGIRQLPDYFAVMPSVNEAFTLPLFKKGFFGPASE
jgi:hypothetical protein